MTTRTKVTRKMKAILMRPAVALLLTGCFAMAYAQKSASGQLYVYGNVEASYYLEAKGDGYTSIGQGVAEGFSLRASVVPGRISVRVLKANSSSATYTAVVRGGKEDLTLRDLPYNATITDVIPDSKSDVPLVLFVKPE